MKFRADMRVRLESMPDDPDPIAVGSLGTVEEVRGPFNGRTPWWQVFVRWDNGRKLVACVPPDVLVPVIRR